MEPKGTARENTVERKVIPKPNNAFMIHPKDLTDLFRKWCIFLRPFVYLTDREIEIVACFLKHRFALSKVISDQTILDRTVMGNDIKEKVREECNISLKHFYVMESKLAKKEVIKDKMLNPLVVPNLKPGSDNLFQMTILFTGFDMSTDDIR